MRRLALMLACSALLAVTAAAQTSPAPSGERVLEIYQFVWSEATEPNPCSDCYGMTSAAVKYRLEHQVGRGDYGVVLVLKNVSRKPIRSVSVGFVFRDAETDRVFLTYHTRFDRRIGPGEKKRLRHTVKKGEEPDSFSPAAPGAALLDRTNFCGDRSFVYDRKSRTLVKREVWAGEEPFRNWVCFVQPAVTRIDYEDGTFWRP